MAFASNDWDSEYFPDEHMQILRYFHEELPVSGLIDGHQAKLLGNSNQVSFITDGPTTFAATASLTISFYSTGDCTGDPTTQDISSLTTLGVTTLTSSDASNNALCNSVNGQVAGICSSAGSVRFNYTYTDTTTSFTLTIPQCIPGHLQSSSGDACSGSDCGFGTVVAPVHITPLMIRVSTELSGDNHYTGGLGGAGGADSNCQSALAVDGHPSLLYNALLFARIGTSGTICRQACASGNGNCTSAGDGGQSSNNINWVMQPNTVYVNSAGQFLWLTNGAGVTSASINLANAVSGTATNVWTALLGDWTPFSNADCDNWADGTSAHIGVYGTASSLNSGLLTRANQGCNNSNGLLCVQQRTALPAPGC